MNTRNVLKMAGVAVIATRIVLLAIGRNSTNNGPAAPNLPVGTYWNFNAGFGDSELKLMPGGRYTNGGIGSISVEGNYTLQGDRIVFTEYGPADAPCRYLPGTYKWSVNRDVLRLKEIEDTCPTRQYDWGSGWWFKQGQVPQMQ